MPGKKKCRILQEIRQRIAEENDIPLVTEECRYKGDCRGTCPRCESELRYLEQQLEKRRALGKKVTVSAMALGLAATLGGCHVVQPSGYLEGDVPMSVEETEPDGAPATPEDAEPTQTEATTEDETFAPSANINEDVYGPPAPDDGWA